MSGEALDQIRMAIGPSQVLTDPDAMASYLTDWTRRWTGSAVAVVRPDEPEAVATIMSICHRHGLPVVPQGGNTGLVGGGIPRAGAIVLSMARMRQIGPVDVVGRRATVEAGATLAAVHDAVRASGLDFGVELAARDSATIGGMVASNAGGVHVVAHGSMRANVLGLEVVLADGSVVSRLGGLAKDNAGYDLVGLFHGSEGTLGIVTRVMLRLIAPPSHRTAALLGLDGVDGAIEVLTRLHDALPGIESTELMLADGLELTARHGGMPLPFDRAYGCYLIMEVGGAEDTIERLASVVEELPQIRDVAVGVDAAARARLWAYRERHTEAVASLGIPHKFDVAVPLARLNGFIRDLAKALRGTAPGARIITWGHIAEGNLHVNVIPTAPLGPGDVDALDALVYELVATNGGTISAEHGVGRAKARYLHLVRGAEDIAAMRAIKAALDPQGLLNPGVIFELT